MPSQRNIIDDIYSRVTHMSPSDKKIAQVVLDEPAKVVDYTIAQLSKKADVSEASVSRFCKNLNLTGFHQLKTQLAQISNDKNNYYKNIEGDDLQASLKNITDNKIAEITSTLGNLSSKDVDKILNLIKNSRIVQLAAEGDTYPVVEDAIYKLNQIGILAIGSSTFETALAQTLNLNEDDLLIVISNSGETRELINQIEAAHAQNIKVIAITNRSDSPIASRSDFHLETSVRQRVFQSEYYFSRIAASALIEALFLLLIARDKSTLDKIRHHEGLIADKKI